MDKIVLICATGRSGSTTMQRIINSIPNSNICGENDGSINSLLDFYIRIKYASSNYIPGKFKPASYEECISKNIKPSWYNSYDFASITQQIRNTIISMFKNKETTNLWGFKEIRYDNTNVKYLKEFKELFPQTKVIIQIRENIREQQNSGWYKGDKNATRFLINYNNELVKFYNENKSWCYLTSFERMFNQQNIKNIFKFIDCENSYHEHNIQDILNIST